MAIPDTVVSDTAHLTIGDVAARTGVSVATLRAWERRHGFPQPQRLPGGHRRYDEDECERVAEVVRRRDAGTRLEAAIADLNASSVQGPGAPSVFAELRSRHPELASMRLRKSMMLAMSWAIEDEALASAARPLLFGAFQEERQFRVAQSRWSELARVAEVAVVFSDFAALDEDADPALVPLAADAPMRHEWSVVCDSAGFSAALSAWEVPGQEGVANMDRVMESVWSVDPRVVRNAAYTCARVAEASGYAAAGQLIDLLRSRPVSTLSTPGVTLFNRIVSYADGVR